jgi:hypothetical protein
LVRRKHGREFLCFEQSRDGARAPAIRYGKLETALFRRGKIGTLSPDLPAHHPPS